MVRHMVERAPRERDMLDNRSVARAIAALMLTLVCVAAIAAGVLALARRDLPPAGAAMNPTAQVSPPRISARDERRALELDQRARLSQYRWLNRDAGVVGIPIDRAIGLLVERDAAARGGGRR
jgi:hypothetical protein